MSWQNSSDVEAEGSVAARAAARNRMDSARGWDERAQARARRRIWTANNNTDTPVFAAFKPIIKAERKPSNGCGRDALIDIALQCLHFFLALTHQYGWNHHPTDLIILAARTKRYKSVTVTINARCWFKLQRWLGVLRSFLD